MKKLLFLKLLALAACLSSALSATAYDFKYGNFYYNILTNTSSSRTVEVTNSGVSSATADYPNSSYSVPSTVTYNGYTYTVTAIGDYAFRNPESGYDVSKFTSITLPSTITTIGEYAFSSTYISTITLPSSLTTIGANAFSSIYNLTSITIPNSVTSIGRAAFSQCWSLQTVNLNLSSGLTSIPDYCFYECNALSSFTVPNQVQTIGNYAFYQCPIETVTLGFRVSSIGDYAFSYSQSPQTIWPKVYCYAYDPPTIQSHTFNWCYSGAGQINGDLYTLCRRYDTYCNATYWKTFYHKSTISGNEYYDYSYNGVYYWFNPGLETAVVTYKDTNYNSYSGQVTIPATVSWRGMSFYVLRVDENAFRNCTGLTRFDASSASHLSTIQTYAFYGCTSLSTVYLPSSISTIKDYAFYNCPLSYLKVPRSTPPTVYANTFTGNYSSCIVVVPTPADILTYQATDYWKKFLKYASIQDYDFSYNGLYYAITGSNTVKVVHRNLSEYGNAYYNYHGDIVIPATVPYNGTTYSVTAIDDCAFSQRVSDNKSGADGEPTLGATYDPLTSVTIGSNVKTIGQEAFEYASSLTTITIPNSVTSIGANAFEYSGLKSVTLGTGLTSIGANAFLGCTALTTIRSNRTTPPTIQSTTFETSHYSAATVYVPSSAVNSYKNKTYWKNFYLIVPNNGTELNYVLNVSGGNISFTSTGDYPWTIKADANRTYAQSSNAGVASTTSTMTATVTVTKASTVSFDFKAWGEGTNYDVCTFEIDGVQQFKYGARQNDWENFTADLAVGTHTLTWTYSKDSSVNPTGDYFAVDNVAIAEKVDAPGDVNGDGSVTIADVTTLIDILLSGVNAPAGADVNGDNAVTIADVTALIDMLLAGN